MTNGVYIITAGHCLFTSGSIDVLSSSATFELPGNNNVMIAGEAYFPEPSFNDSQFGRDLALVRLAIPAPQGAERRDIYRASDEVSRTGTKLGYGHSGTGATGATQQTFGTKRLGYNRYDADGSVLNAIVNPTINIAPGLSLAYDFDNGLAANDAFAVSIGPQYANLGLGAAQEAMIAGGDSGGPTLIDNKIAAITSGRRRTGSPPDVSTHPFPNSTFGEFGLDTRVSAFASWIDQITTPPKVVGVTIGSNGAQIDYDVPADGTGAQRKSLPLFNAGAVNEIKIKFSEQATVQQSHLTVRPVGGSSLTI